MTAEEEAMLWGAEEVLTGGMAAAKPVVEKTQNFMTAEEEDMLFGDDHF